MLNQKIEKMKYIILILFSLYGESLIAQCNSDNHSTAKTDSWISCQKSLSSNTDRPEGHWLMMDLGSVRRLSKAHIWNQNSMSEAGIKTLAIDVSNDGVTWQQAKEINLNQATNSNQYEGEDVEPIDAEGRYVLFFAKETFGDDNCAGLSEIKIETRDVITSTEVIEEELFNISIAPNPASSVINVDFGFEGTKTYQIISMTGNVMYRSSTTANYITQDISFLQSGMYILYVRNKNGIFSQKRFIVI